MSAVDIVAIRQHDGSIKSTSFYVFFPSRKESELVYVSVNDVPIPGLTMMAHQTGHLFFSPEPSRKAGRTSKDEMKAGQMDIVHIDINSVDASEIAQQEGENTEQLKEKIKEEEKEIRDEILEEKLVLGPIADIPMALMGASARPSKSEPSSPANRRPVQRNGSFEFINGMIKSLWPSNKPAPNNNNGTVSTTPADAVLPVPESAKKEDTVMLNKVPTPAQLEMMRLKDGVNKVQFRTSQTNQVATVKLFLWDCTTKIIISDIDGTITKTDKRGLFYYRLGYDWTHDKVVDLYKQVHTHGYNFIYLTARSFKVQAATRSYLDKIAVPEGPILCAPHDLFACVTTEFWKTTAQGKLSHLEPLKSIFPADCEPLTAGFGNKVHDHVCYKAIGIPAERIYIINKSSEITVNGLKTNYDTLLQIASVLFPIVNRDSETHSKKDRVELENPVLVQ